MMKFWSTLILLILLTVVACSEKKVEPEKAKPETETAKKTEPEQKTEPEKTPDPAPTVEAKKVIHVGDYVGKFKPVSTVNAAGTVTPQPKCGPCHALATISKDNEKYLLKLTVKRGVRGDRILNFQGALQRGSILFKNGPFTITAANGKITGERKGKMNAKITLAKGETK